MMKLKLIITITQDFLLVIIKFTYLTKLIFNFLIKYLATGHFTQVVWKSTTQLGCGLAVNRGNKIYGVCNYSPAGNVVNAGFFKANVLPLRSG